MIIHRDYAHSSDSVIKIFDNRIEFFNPGSLLPPLTIDKLLSGDYASNTRNKQIANLFKEAGLIEKYGSGIKRIKEAFVRDGFVAPRFEVFQHGFKVTVFNESYIMAPIMAPINDAKKLPTFYGQTINYQ
jgi:ATP-dependent DNA helicase RecG